MTFRAANHGATSVEEAEFNPKRAITEEQPMSHRPASPYYDPMKAGGRLHGWQGEIWELPAFPEDDDCLNEPTPRFANCIRVVRDAVRPRSRETRWELEELRPVCRPRGFLGRRPRHATRERAWQQWLRKVWLVQLQLSPESLCPATKTHVVRIRLDGAHR